MPSKITHPDYGDEHRIFLQAIMNKGILEGYEVFNFFTIACERAGVPVASDQTMKNKQLVKFLKIINEEIGKHCGMKIVKATDEENSLAHYTLVTRGPSENNLLARRAMVEFEPQQVEHLRLIMDAIVHSEDKEISSVDVANLAKKVVTTGARGGKSFHATDGEKWAELFKKGKWLKETTEGKVRNGHFSGSHSLSFLIVAPFC